MTHPTDLTDRLRDSLTKRAGDAPEPGFDPHLVMRRGRRVRRLRRGAAGVAVVLAVCLVVSGTALAGRLINPAREPAPPAAPVAVGRPKVAVIVADRLHLPTGRSVPLPPRGSNAPEWSTAEPVLGGWVVGNGFRAELVRSDGSTHTLANVRPAGHLPNVSAVASPDGRRVALGVRTDEGVGPSVRIVDVASAAVTAQIPTNQAVPAGWYRDQLILRRGDTGEGAHALTPARLSRWDPRAGPWDGQFTAVAIGLIGPAADSDRLLGYVNSANGTPCFGTMDPMRDFAIATTSCASDGISFASPSPDRQHLVIGSETGAADVSYVVHRVTATGTAVARKLNLPANRDASAAVWESPGVVDLFTSEANGNPTAVRVLRCRIATGACADVPTGVSGAGQVTIAPAGPPDTLR